MIEFKQSGDYSLQCDQLHVREGLLLRVWIPPGTVLPTPIQIPAGVEIQSMPYILVTPSASRREDPQPPKTWWQRLFS